MLPECLDDFVADDNPVRVVDAFVSERDLQALGFDGLTPASRGRILLTSHSYSRRRMSASFLALSCPSTRRG